MGICLPSAAPLKKSIMLLFHTFIHLILNHYSIKIFFSVNEFSLSSSVVCLSIPTTIEDRYQLKCSGSSASPCHAVMIPYLP